MIKKKLQLGMVVLISLILLIISVNAEDISCDIDEDCIEICQDEGIENCYCDLTMGVCMISDSNTTTEDQTTTTETNQTTTVDVSGLEAEFEEELLLEETLESLGSLDEKVEVIQSNLNIISQQVNNLQSQQVQLNENLQTINYKLENDLNTISTGLAGLQTNLEDTQTELSTVEDKIEERENFDKLVKWIFFIVIVLVVAVAVILYITKYHQPKKEVHAEVIKYITKKIKTGMKYPHIKQDLLKAGWPGEEIELAYKKTIKSNYNNYLKKSGTSGTSKIKTKKVGYDTRKVISIVVISILLIFGGLFILRGVTTGQAIYFQSQDQFNLNVKSNLEDNIENSVFYNLVPLSNICVQVNDGEKTISYQIIKSSLGHAIREAPLSCDNTDNYDFSVKFLNWNSFNYLSNKLTCENINLVNIKDKNVIILPSKFILPGFRLSGNVDANIYCKALSECLTKKELGSIGLKC